MINFLISGLFAIVLIGSVPVQAGEKRHHGAHVHGVATLNVAIEGNNVYIEFSSPAANIVGFEHHPRAHEQKDAVQDAVNKLQNGDALFILSAGSEGKLVKSDVNTDINKDSAHHSESEHAHAKEGQHGQEDHHDKKHGEADEHDTTDDQPEPGEALLRPVLLLAAALTHEIS